MSETAENNEGAVEYGGSNDSIEEFGQRFSTPTPQDLSQIKLEGDTIPENLRGKSVSDVLAEQARLRQALQLSEDARLALKNSQEAVTSANRAPAPAAPPAPVPEQELNEEQLQELFDQNPRKYQDYLTQRTEQRLMRAVQGSIAPVVNSSADLVLRDAQNRFPDEFAAFGEDIQSFISALPDKSSLANPGAMGELMDYMRGKHWQKFSRHLAQKSGGRLEDVRQELGNQTPSDFSNSPQPPRQRGGSVQLDDTMKQIADALGVSYEDYAKGLTQRDLRMIRDYGNR
jgi:hypothetical protein